MAYQVSTQITVGGKSTFIKNDDESHMMTTERSVNIPSTWRRLDGDKGTMAGQTTVSTRNVDASWYDVVGIGDRQSDGRDQRLSARFHLPNRDELLAENRDLTLL